jgi:phage tail-like protein
MSASQLPFVGNFNFLVEIEGVTPDSTSVVGGFSEASGITSQSEVIEYRVGNSKSVLKIPGRSRAGNIVLRKGVTSGDEISRWRSAIEKGVRDVRSGSIILLDAEMNEKTRWNFFDAWPCRYEGPTLDAAGAEVAVETLELCVDRIERVEPSARR